MSDVTMEQKLQLVRQVRSRYHENQYDMSNRERILYGKSSIPFPEEDAMRYSSPYDERGETIPEEEPLSFFRFRFWAALLLLTAVIVMDRNQMEVAGITSEKIFEAIAADYEEVVESWVETFAR